jgi:PKD repeat protein
MNRRLILVVIPVLFVALVLAALLSFPARVQADQHGVYPAQPDTSGWVIECVDCPKSFYSLTDRSLALDADGNPHLVYGGGDHLYYAWYDGSAWNYETADDSPLTGLYPSLALDAEGKPHVSYVDYTNHVLMYAYRDAGGWHTEIADNPGWVDYTSIALDTDGNVHISYGTSVGLKYAFHDASGWQTEVVDASGYGWGNSLALDPNGYPYISYTDTNTYYLMLAHQDIDGWYINVADSANEVMEDTSIAITDIGYIYVSYIVYVDSMPQLWLFTSDAAGWNRQVLDSQGSDSTSITLDDQGYPHISYTAVDSAALMYAFKDVDGWHYQTADPAGNCSRTSIALDAGGVPHIGYTGYWEGFNGLKFASLEGDAWQTSVVDISEGDAGNGNSLILDVEGNAYISYARSGRLTYAYQDAANWHFESIDSVASFHGTSLALDTENYPHVAYSVYSSGQYDLRYAYQDASGWYTETVLTNPGWNSDKSLALDGDNFPHISYYDSYNGNLLYAYKDAVSWHIEVVDSVDDVGRDNSLALDENGYPHISYIAYGVNQGLRYAYLDAEGWHIETVDGSSNVGAISLVLDGNGYPHISYLHGSSHTLKYAHQDAGGWNIEDIGWVGDVSSTSLALGGDGLPRISYGVILDGYHTDLWYAYKEPGAWQFELVDSGARYDPSSLALDANDTPHISYYDSSDGDLKYAVYVFTPVSPTLVTIDGTEAGLVGQTYTFTATVEPLSITLPVEYVWETTGQPPLTHTGGLLDTASFSWQVLGEQVITVTASNDFGTVTDTHTILISEVPISGLQVVNDSPTQLGEMTTLAATVDSGSNVSYSWDFGDGLFGEGATVSHTYPAVGDYTAVVTASNSLGDVMATTLVMVTDIPIGGLQATSNSPTQLSEATYLTATVASGSNVSYSWDFGDKSFGEGAVVLHTYSAVGVYTAVVTATNGIGLALADTVITITDIPISGLSAENNSPTLLGSPTTLTVTLTSGSNVSYSWNFGDGTYGIGSVVTHTYSESGVYTAVVTATNSVNSLVATTIVTITTVETNYQVYLPFVAKDGQGNTSYWNRVGWLKGK